MTRIATRDEQNSRFTRALEQRVIELLRADSQAEERFQSVPVFHFLLDLHLT